MANEMENYGQLFVCTSTGNFEINKNLLLQVVLFAWTRNASVLSSFHPLSAFVYVKVKDNYLRLEMCIKVNSTEYKGVG